MAVRAVVEAVIVAGTVETPYRRAGRGATVLLLGAPALFDELAGTLRVVEPLRLPPYGTRDVGATDAGDGSQVHEDTTWREWLQGLVDGLGLDRPVLVAGAGVVAPLLRAVSGDPDRFGPVVPAESAAGVLGALAVGDEIIDV